MVGDREMNIIGAGEQGLHWRARWVTEAAWNWSSSEAARIAESVEALRAILLGEML